jgi:SAM-dependent methyltransferase
MSRWASASEVAKGTRYAARFAELAASGVDVHGEAALCASLVPAGADVLDAGCGTGRVAVRLAALGYECVGVDLDPAMLDEARRAAPELQWIQADLASFELGRTFDLVVAAGNVIPFVAAGTESAVVARLAAHLRPAGLLVCGFGLDSRALPPAAAPVGLAAFDGWCVDAGLRVRERFATWDAQPYDGGAYAVTVLSRPR